MKAANETRVGLVVIIALVLIVGGYFALRGVGLGAQQYYLKLDGAALIAQGNDVRLQGVKVGVVQDVSLDPGTQKPLLTLAIQRNDPPFSLYRSYKYAVRSSGIIGENYVDIQGTPVSGDEAYIPNDKSQLIAARSAAGLADVGERADAIAGDVQQTLKKLNTTLDRINSGVLSANSQAKLVSALDGVAKLTNQASKSFGPNGIKVGLVDPQTQRALNATFINAAVAANEAALAARDVRKLTAAAGGVLSQSGNVIAQAGGVLSDSRGQLNKLLTNLDRTTSNAADTIESVNFLVKNSGFEKGAASAFGSLNRAAKNIEDTTENFKGLSDEQTQKDLRATLTAMRESTEALRDTTNSIKSFVADDGSQTQLKSTLVTLNTTASTLAETTTNLRDATAGIKNIFADEKLQSDAKAIPAELRKTLEATTATAQRLNGFLGGRNKPRDASQSGAAEKSGALSGGLLDDLSFTARHLSQGDERNFGDVRLHTELFGAPFRIGLDEIGEGSKFTLQSGRFIGDNAAIRYGLYRSKLGLGAELRQGRFSLEGNYYDPNRRSGNVYGGVRLSPKIELLVGRENRGDVRSNAIGVRLRP